MRHLSLTLLAVGGLGMLALSGCSGCGAQEGESASASEPQCPAGSTAQHSTSATGLRQYQCMKN